ncbi:hypothetical protein [Flavobacterium agrisoli]|uniref:Uncharacterized protein n=1 Tax=Flavobacterium agrisoli TaxID=2793066 RepID=A0A934UKN1_9FLAO|nr:hypothetical protein [Flavobacterium agrisoli]MBK0370620.1 hypothetical protein [Flavobacterium agrisoli]
MKAIHYFVYGAVLSLFSCNSKSDEKSKADPRLITPFTQQAYSATPQPAKPVQHNLFHENNAITTPSVAAGINPAHGQPGHRCDIPVGAPLNTNTSVQTAAATNSTQQVQLSQPVVSKTVTPKGMNPPHGEKGHRCDIPVGAPLNSKPATTTSTSVPQATATSGEVSKQISVQPPVPALLSTASTNPVTTAEGMNPPHGQEGHRCDIAVGAPLPKS